MTTEAAAPRRTQTRRAGGIARLAGNELPHEPPARVLAAIRDNDSVNRYPDPSYAALNVALAEHLNVSAENLMLGAGSSSVLQRLFRVACPNPGDAVMWTAPNFDAFTIFARQAGALPQTVPPTADGAVDLAAMLAAITPATRLIVLVNPHNPTGAAIGGEQLRAFLAQVDYSVTVVLDEAYQEFCTDPLVADGLDIAKARWAEGHHNVAVVRTFSKAYGLAGIRVGYGIAPEPLARKVRDEAVPRELSLHATLTAAAALTAHDDMRANVARIVAERERVLRELRAMDFAPEDSQANFVWLPLGEDAARFAAHCWVHSVLVLAVDNHGVRVSIGNKADNDAFLRTAHTWATGRATT